jgi:lipopolysaccharide biosynthesis protein
MLRSGRPDFPFCVCWANENWSRRWDGRDKDLLITQHYSAEDDLAFINALIPLFEDPRYIRINGRPLLMIYRAGLLPDAVSTTECWRQACAKTGIKDPYLVHVRSFDAEAKVMRGFDAAVEFPPHGGALSFDEPLEITNAEFCGRLYDYARTAQAFQAALYPEQNFFRTVMPSWDNTARRQNDADIFVNSTPELYQRWLTEAIKETRELKFGDERLVFINAWNEWAEGNHLEPDKRYGHDYLEATGRALNAALGRGNLGQ